MSIQRSPLVERWCHTIAVEERESRLVGLDPTPLAKLCCCRHTLGQGVCEWATQNQTHWWLIHVDCTGHHGKSIREALFKLRKDCPILGVLVIGRTGAGKSTLINNLLGKEVVHVGHTLKSEKPMVNPYVYLVEGVPIEVRASQLAWS